MDLVDGFPIETSIYWGFPIAMFDYQRVDVLFPLVGLFIEGLETNPVNNR